LPLSDTWHLVVVEYDYLLFEPDVLLLKKFP
jgi:hypothetical protein